MRNDSRTCSSGGRSTPTEPSSERRQDDSHDGTGAAGEERAELLRAALHRAEAMLGRMPVRSFGRDNVLVDVGHIAKVREAIREELHRDDYRRPTAPSVTAATWSAIESGDLRTAAALALLQADDARGAIALHDAATTAEELARIAHEPDPRD